MGERTLIVDTLGLPISVVVTAANISDNQAGIFAIDKLKGKVSRLKKVAADKGYKQAFKSYVEARYEWIVEIAQKPESSKSFVPEKNRWQVERSFSWLNLRRRLFKNVEKTIESAEAMLEIAFTSIMLNRLAN